MRVIHVLSILVIFAIPLLAGCENPKVLGTVTKVIIVKNTTGFIEEPVTPEGIKRVEREFVTARTFSKCSFVERFNKNAKQHDVLFTITTGDPWSLGEACMLLIPGNMIDIVMTWQSDDSESIEHYEYQWLGLSGNIQE